MNSVIILNWSIVILTIISIVVFFQIRNKKREKKIVSVLHNFAKEYNSKISEYDHWDNSLIGIDNNEVDKLFFIRTINNKELKKVIHLSEVLNCQLVKSERNVQYNKEKVNVIEKIELVFSFVNTNEPEISLEFYNAEFDHLTLTGELQIAQKWSGIIKSILITNKNWENKVYKSKLRVSSSINKPMIHDHSTFYSIKRKDRHISREVLTN